jgi:hypothetical protein
MMWTDSQNVLAWVKNDDLCLQTFVHNRVKIIHECTAASSWRWVDTEQNPADHLSRGKTVGELLDLTDWWGGPSFLKESMDEWPADKRKPNMSDEAAQELKQNAIVCVSKSKNSLAEDLRTDYENFSSWNRLVRAMAAVIKFQRTCRRWIAEGAVSPCYDPPSLGEAGDRPKRTIRPKYSTKEWITSYLTRAQPKKKLSAWTLETLRKACREVAARLKSRSSKVTAEEVAEAEIYVLRRIQQEAFAEELTDLAKSGEVKHGSALRRERPRLDTDGIMRAMSRLRDNLGMAEAARKPTSPPHQSVRSKSSPTVLPRDR